MQSTATTLPRISNPVTVRTEGTYGGDILLVSNPTGGALDHHFHLAARRNGRVGDITAYSVGAGVTSAFKYSNLLGGQTSAATCSLQQQAGLLVAVLKR